MIHDPMEGITKNTGPLLQKDGNTEFSTGSIHRRDSPEIPYETGSDVTGMYLLHCG